MNLLLQSYNIHDQIKFWKIWGSCAFPTSFQFNWRRVACDGILEVIGFVQKKGFIATIVLPDNIKVNQKLFKLLCKLNIFWFENPSHPDLKIFVMFDPAHLMKHFWNNWINLTHCAWWCLTRYSRGKRSITNSSAMLTKAKHLLRRGKRPGQHETKRDAPVSS